MSPLLKGSLKHRQTEVNKEDLQVVPVPNMNNKTLSFGNYFNK